MRRLVVICTFLLNFGAHAQMGKEAWHWQFGYGCSLDFSSGVPVSGSSAVYVLEGSASYSDPVTGQLLFYTDGDTVWDKNNNVMQNGAGLIGGDGTSTQAALIIPKPGSNNLFYVITSDQGGYGNPNQGIFYSMIDITLNGGLGAVIQKNQVLLPPPATEKLTAVPHCNGKDFWIITHPFNSGSFNCYALTAAGIQPSPVVSTVGTFEQNNDGYNDETIGYLVPSLNGKKLALGISYHTLITEIYDFDNATGKITNPVTILDTNFLGSGAYGICFSPDNTKLYTSNWAPGSIFQYDLSSGIASSIIASKTLVATLSADGAMQLGPDGKIYVSQSNSNYLAVINQPNVGGVSCNFQNSAVYLSSGVSGLGLPNFVSYNYGAQNLSLPDIVKCGTFTTDTLSAGGGFTSYLWSTGATTQSVVVNNPGTFWVQVQTADGCIINDTAIVKVIDPTHHHLIASILCGSNGYYLADVSTSGALTYNWSNGSVDPTNCITSPGIYWVDIDFGSGCSVRDSFKYSLVPDPVIPLPYVEIACNSATNLPVILNAGSGAGYSYHWNTGATTSTISVNSSGNYSVTVETQQGCISSRAIQLYYYGKSAKPLFDTLVFCDNQFPITLDATVASLHTPYNYYLWSTGNTGAVTSINSSGLYTCNVWIQTQNGQQCPVKDSFQVNVLGLPPAKMLPDMFVDCDRLPLLVDASYPMTDSYVWSDGFSGPKHYVSQPGYYNVQYHFNSKCNSIEYFTVAINNKKREISFPNIVTPNGDGVNDHVDLAKYSLDEVQLEIFDRWGRSVYDTNDAFAQWYPTQPDGTYFYVLWYKDLCGAQTTSEIIKGFITILR